VVTTAHQSRYLAELINQWRPGRAKYVEVAGMDHGLGRAPGGDFHTGLLDAMFSWLDGIG
jgi:hypothetical protein